MSNPDKTVNESSNNDSNVNDFSATPKPDAKPDATPAATQVLDYFERPAVGGDYAWYDGCNMYCDPSIGVRTSCAFRMFQTNLTCIR